MSEKDYVTVSCRVPAGLLKEGEALEWRKPEPNERFLTTSRDMPIMQGVCTIGERRPVIIPAFDANDWADRNLPKPACEREVWAAMVEARVWFAYSDDPRPTGRGGWYASEPGNELGMMVGPDEFKLPWEQSKFKWTKWECSTLDEGGVETADGAVLRWVWHGGGK